MSRSLSKTTVIGVAVMVLLVSSVSIRAQPPQPDLTTLRAQARQLVSDSAFDLSQHGVADSQHLVIRQPGPPEVRFLGPYVRAWPRADNHRVDPDDLVGRIAALIVSDSAYAPLALPAGSSYVYVESLDPARPCVQGRTANGQVRIVPADQRFDATNTTLAPQPLCYTDNPMTERGFLGIGRRPQQNHRSRVEWRSPNDALWFICASHGCCYAGNGLQ